MVGHPVQSFFQLWWDTLYNPSATSMTRNLGFESLPFQKNTTHNTHTHNTHITHTTDTMHITRTTHT